MKNNILKVTLVAAITLVSGYNVYNSHKAVGMSDSSVQLGRSSYKSL